ncbi:AAC(3) family N-acetyltransferase [Deinococcus sp. KNUC1210]|uniref:AAC(3) family N-acetyltransferase n=1 Tax=Deinococcus sp. KNUC1210 TaxID=2917691 RepID=UPI001EF14DA0|nr:AAC(3) family N-acetyltransferase [Deinococcus sp. KNUC1210]ULH15790.1 AAC(3) family N-acetyltransferase [Deinococcus sp. KNUC1210]
MLNLARRVHVTPRQLDEGLSALGLDGSQHVIVHSSLKSFGLLEGGASTLLHELGRHTATLAAPAFSYQTLLRGPDSPIHAQFHRDTRVSRDIGRLPQSMVEQSEALRSSHPALSFVALGQEAAFITGQQSLGSPYAPIGALYDLDGYALLIGVDHSSNTSIHYGEHVAGMPLLTRYVPQNGVAVPSAFPNCSADFETLAPYLQPSTVYVGKSRLRLYRVRALVDATVRLLTQDPEALLCTYPSCRCQQVRQMVRQQGLHPRAHPLISADRARGERSEASSELTA